MKRAAKVLVFIPGAGIGHVVATAELAKLLVNRDEHLFITILVIKHPTDEKQIFTNTDSSISQRINFIDLPKTHVDTQGLSHIIFHKILVENNKTQVRDAVAKLAESDQSESKPRLAGLVVDMFTTTMIDVAKEFGVPSYVFFTSSGVSLSLSFHLQTLQDEHGKDGADWIRSSGAELVDPSFVNPVPIGVLPVSLLHKETAVFYLNNIRRFRETKGILVNTFLELESHPLLPLISSNGETPPVYPVGPLLNLQSSDNVKGLDIMEWLDDQPPSSVVFLCFGSLGSFGEAQVKEIARGLEDSGHRFLWSLRQPAQGKMGIPDDYADSNEVLPEGFLDRTSGIGKVIGWAPQAAILAHPATGGFVSHCGWNSTLESVWFGVPIAAWPMYAEQQLNAFELVKELGLAVEVKMDYEMGSGEVVSAQDIERGIRQVMEPDSDTRKRMKEKSQKSKKALMEGGSSYSSLKRFVDQI